MSGITSGQFSRRLMGWLVVVILLVGLLGINGPSVPVAQAATFDIPSGDVTALKAALQAPGSSNIINLAPRRLLHPHDGRQQYYGRQRPAG